MADVTANYSFKKRKIGHPVRDDDVGDNLVLIDAAIKAREDETDGITVTANTWALEKATITLTAATKLNLGAPIIDITSGIVEMGSQGSGIALTTAQPFGFDLHVKPTTELTAGDTGRSCGIRMRYEVGADQGNQISIAGVLGHLRVKKDLADGVHAGVEGYVEISGVGTVISGTSTTQTTAGAFAVEADANFEITTGWLTGVVVDSSINASANISAAEFAGFRVKKTGSAKDWEYGLHIRDSTTGIDIGACTTGINFTGACTNAAISMDGATFANLDHEIQMRNTITGDKTIIASGAAASDADIRTAVGADADIADGSLYMSVVDGTGKLFCKQNDVWTDISTA